MQPKWGSREHSPIDANSRQFRSFIFKSKFCLRLYVVCFGKTCLKWTWEDNKNKIMRHTILLQFITRVYKERLKSQLNNKITSS